MVRSGSELHIYSRKVRNPSLKQGSLNRSFTPLSAQPGTHPVLRQEYHPLQPGTKAGLLAASRGQESDES